MTWFRLDDGFHAHPKVLEAGNAAVGLWVRCATWASANLTDGHIPAKVARSYGTRPQIDALVDAGLWEAVPDGFRIPDFTDYNPSRAQIRAEREAQRERQSRHRRTRNEQATPAVTRDDAEMSRRDMTVSHAVTNALVTAPRPDPTRPDPSPACNYSDRQTDIHVPEVVRQALDLAVAHWANLAAGTITNVERWKAATWRRALDERGPELLDAHRAHPDAGPERIAQALGLTELDLYRLREAAS